MWAMKHMSSGHQYTPIMEHVTHMYMVAIDTGNGQQRDVATDVIPCPNIMMTFF